MLESDLKINSPSTPFPMEAKLIERLQPEILQKWRALDIYRIILEDRRAAESFILHDGPPFASGQTHIGIGFNKILKDIIAKYHSMRGSRVPFIPGWDCHGLPIESQVLNDAKDSRVSLSALEVRERCMLKADQHIREQKSLFQTLGVFADWDRPYSTMSSSYEAGVLDVLAEVLSKGYIYKALRPVHWCPVCQTVLADVEVKERLAENFGALAGFQLEGNSAKFIGDEVSVKPFIVVQIKDVWMLPSCTALAILPERQLTALSYIDQNGSEQIIIVDENSLETICRHLNIQSKNVIKIFMGQELSNYSVVHPLTKKNIPIIFDPGLNKKIESSVLPITPPHSMRDYLLALKHNLEIPVLVDKHGQFNLNAGNLTGKTIQDAEKIILSALKTLKIPLSIVPIKKKEDYGLRCGHSIYMFPTQQWFLNVDHREQDSNKTLRQKALEEVDHLIQWIHQEDQQELYKKIESRPDWCISRQRNWGIPIPTIICSFCKEVLLKTEVVKVARDLIALHGSQFWFAMDFSELISNLRLKDLTCDKCGRKKFEKDLKPNVLDVWFESGTSWRSVLINDHRLSFPADLCIEGEDQHRGWFQMSLLLSLIIQDKSPFRTALAHGFVLDEKRRRLSKLDKNFLSLEEVLQQVPVDLLRLYFVLNKNIRESFPLSIPSILELEPEYRTFRNCFRYLLLNLNDYIPSENSVPLTGLNDIDKWILCRLHRLIDDVTKDYSAYRFKDAMEKLYAFCNNDLNKIYFETVKDKLKYDMRDSHQRRSIQTAMHSLIMALVKILAPILVYTCEEVWSFCPGVYDCGSVHLSLWVNEREGMWLRLQREGNDLEKEYDWMLKLRNALQPGFEKAKHSGIFNNNKEIKLTLYVAPSNKEIADILTSRKQELQEFLNIPEIIITDSADNLEEVPELEEKVFYKLEISRFLSCLRCRRLDPTVVEEIDKPMFCTRCFKVLFPQTTGTKYTSFPEITEKTSPVKVAEYMQRMEIRKVAFLNEEGRVVPYYLHLPSQRVRINTGLQPLANYLEKHHDFKNHSAVLLGLGEHTNVLFGIGIHQLKHGTPLGGTREFTYENVGDMLENLLRLSYGMSIKNSIANLPHGGGKSIIDTCELDLKVHRELRRRIYRDFGQFTATLFGRYICAEDMNNTSADTREMLAWCRHVMCLPEGVGGSGNPSRFTALVGWLAAKVGWKFQQEREGKTFPTSELNGVTVAIQGVGNVGFNLIDILTEGGSDLKRILIADTEPVQIENVRKLLQRKGKVHLLGIRSAKDPLVDKSKATEKEILALKESLQDAEDENTYVLYSQCDILVPAAVGNVIYSQNTDFLNCKVIVPIANNAYSDNDSIGRKIWERKIVDVVEGNVNWGGATVAASELYGYDEDHVIEWCAEKVCNETIELLKTSFDTQTPPWEIKKRQAEEKFKEPHQLIKIAREGKFIVDISKDFNKWIKEKWLRNTTSVSPDKFAEYVSLITQPYLPLD